MQKERKVSYKYNQDRHTPKQIPFIRLSGEWLASKGFHVGSKFNLSIVDGDTIVLKKKITNYN